MREPQRLYTANEIAKMLGVSRHWVLEHFAEREGPAPQFQAMRGKVGTYLWTVESLDAWRAYHAGGGSVPSHRTNGYSDHNAVNQVGPVTVTWKLWWRPRGDGMVQWWFSTPQGWYCSDDDGRVWRHAETMVRPSDYRYISVNDIVRDMSSATSAVLRSAHMLRQKIERTGQPCVRQFATPPQQWR